MRRILSSRNHPMKEERSTNPIPGGAVVKPSFLLALLVLTVITPAPGQAGPGLTGDSKASGSAASAPSPRRNAADPRLLLPGDGAIPGWMRAEEPRLFNGETLFAHIDGGAEEFLAQGFRALGVGGYRKDSLEIVAEIYDLGTRKGATAILDARGGAAVDEGTARQRRAAVDEGTARQRGTPGDGDVSSPAGPDSAASTPPAVGEACVLDTMQVIFRRSRFYITVTGFEARPEVAAALRVLADSIDARIRAAGRSPAGK